MNSFHINIYRLFSLILIVFFALPSVSQITFEKHYPTPFDKSGKDVLPIDDGGYLIATTTENSDPNDLDIQIIKTNSYGDIITTKTYTAPMVDYPNEMLRTNDGNFFVIGYTRSFGGGDMDIYLMKLNQSGDTIFTKRYGGYGNDEGKEIIATTDGNYLIVGASNSISFSDNNMVLIKIKPNGDILWTKYYGGPNYESARSVKLCPDGGFIVAGKTSLDPLSIASIYLVKTNSSGDTTWTKTYSGGANSWEGKSIVSNNDGTYLLAIDDSSAATDSDVGIMKLNNFGAIIWHKTYGGAYKDICKIIQPTTDGGYIAGCISRSFGWGNPDMWIIKLDANGDSPWTQHFGGSGHEHLYSLHQTSDDGYIAIGHARSFSANWEVYFLKLNPNGVVGIDEFAMNNSTLKIYPNPSSGIINIDFNEKILFTNIKICNALGQIIYSVSGESLKRNKENQIDLKGQSPGLYFLTMEGPTQTTTKKLILN